MMFMRSTLGWRLGVPFLSGVRPTIWSSLPVELREPKVSFGGERRTLGPKDDLVREILVHRTQFRDALREFAPYKFIWTFHI